MYIAHYRGAGGMQIYPYLQRIHKTSNRKIRFISWNMDGNEAYIALQTWWWMRL